MRKLRLSIMKGSDPSNAGYLHLAFSLCKAHVGRLDQVLGGRNAQAVRPAAPGEEEEASQSARAGASRAGL